MKKIWHFVEAGAATVVLKLEETSQLLSGLRMGEWTDSPVAHPPVQFAGSTRGEH